MSDRPKNDIKRHEKLETALGKSLNECDFTISGRIGMSSAKESAGDYAVKLRSASGFALIDLLFVVGIIGILCGIALPRLASAKGTAQSASAIASLRVIGSGQVAFAITCGSGFYAPTLTKLAKPPIGSVDGFIKLDLGAADTTVKSGYQFKMSATPFGGAPDTCNALGPGQTGLAYKAGGDAMDPNNLRFFSINAGNVIWEDNGSLFAAMPEAGDPASGHPIQH
jgi:type II secretory pathway pseudopilin PulG